METIPQITDEDRRLLETTADYLKVTADHSREDRRSVVSTALRSYDSDLRSLPGDLRSSVSDLQSSLSDLR